VSGKRLVLQGVAVGGIEHWPTIPGERYPGQHTSGIVPKPGGHIVLSQRTNGTADHQPLQGRQPDEADDQPDPKPGAQL
jgi:hypothetical protein